ncbi:MAG: hypothetical protein IMZ64_08490 [Bacteroidetes bacterium]|nr:hypothetical protein [Bacteroidota bacterium]
MKKGIIAIIFLALMVVSLMPSIEATDIIDLGTIAYRGGKIIQITQPHNVSLINIYTPIADSYNLSFSYYNPAANETGYFFLSRELPTASIDFTFKNDIKTYLFQDNISNQIYRICIDFSTYVVPSNPLIEQYNNVQKNLSDVFLNYTMMIASFNNMAINYTTVNLLLNNMAIKLNSTNEKLNSTNNQLVTISLNESIAQNRAHLLAREKKSLQDDMLKTQVTAVFLCFFSAVVAVYLGKKFGWLNKTGDRIKKNLATGYGEIPRKIDDYVIKKNDEITREKKIKTEKQKEGPQPTENEESKEGPLDIDDKIDAKIAPVIGKVEKLVGLISSMLNGKTDIQFHTKNLQPEEPKTVEYVEEGQEEITPEIQKEIKPKKRGGRKNDWWDTPAGQTRKEEMRKKKDNKIISEPATEKENIEQTSSSKLIDDLDKKIENLKKKIGE